MRVLQLPCWEVKKIIENLDYIKEDRSKLREEKRKYGVMKNRTIDK